MARGHVIDDGTLHRLDDGSWRWTAAEAQLRWLRLNARGLDVSIEDHTDELAALALQGPLSRAVLEAASQSSLADLPWFERRSLSVGGIDLDVSRTGYTGDLGYELWVARDQAVALWDVLTETGAAYALRPAGILALDIARIEAGLIMAEVDYTSAWHAVTPSQAYSPYELGLGRLVEPNKDVPFVGRSALRREQEHGGPPRRLVGLDLDWADLERLHARHGLTPALSAQAWREQIPVYDYAGQIGRASSGTWSPLLKKNLAIGTLPAQAARIGAWYELEMDRRGRAWAARCHRRRVALLRSPTQAGVAGASQADQHRVDGALPDVRPIRPSWPNASPGNARRPSSPPRCRGQRLPHTKALGRDGGARRVRRSEDPPVAAVGAGRVTSPRATGSSSWPRRTAAGHADVSERSTQASAGTKRGSTA